MDPFPTKRSTWVYFPGGTFPNHDFFFDTEGLDVQALVMEVGQFRSGKAVGVQERSDQTTTAKTVTINENYLMGH